MRLPQFSSRPAARSHPLLARVASGLVLAGVGVAVALGAAGSSGSDWGTFLGPTNDGRSPESGLLLKWPEGGPPLKWQRDLGDGYSMVSIADGRCFIFDRHGDRARLTAVNSETGEELWRSEYPTRYEDYYGYSVGPRASPVIDDDRVYTFGVEGRLRSHRVEDGKLLWEVDTEEEFGVVKNFFGVGSTPVVEGPLLITMIGGSPEDSPKIHSGEVQGNGTGIVAFDKMTGEVRYSVSNELASYSSPRIVTIGSRRWGFLFARGGLVGFEPTTGKVDFEFPWRAKVLESVNAATPVVVDDTIFLSECYGPGSVLLRINGTNPEVTWKDPPRGKSLESHWNTPIHHAGYLYGSSGRNSGNAELRCVKHATGEVQWSEPGLSRSTMLYADGHFVVLTEYGRLLVIEATSEEFRPISDVTLEDPATGKPLLAHPAWNAPVLAHGILYARGKDRLVALDLNPPGTPGS